MYALLPCTYSYKTNNLISPHADVLYLSTPAPAEASTNTDARALLAPYADALLATSFTPPSRLFELFYIQRTLSPRSEPPPAPPSVDAPATQSLFTTPPLPLRGLATAPDAAATNAESLFFSIARSLRALHPDHAVFAPQEEGEGDGEVQATVGEAEGGAGRDQFAELELKFWPPVAVQDEDDDEF